MRILPSLEFISMSDLAFSDKVMETPTNEAKVAIFDIDHCLYASLELKKHDSDFKMSEFIRLSREQGKRSNEEIECMINEKIRDKKTFKDLFCSQLSMMPFEYYSKYDVFDYEQFIRKDEELVSLIASLGQKFRLFAMTNGSDVRAREILNILSLSDYFEKVFCAIIISQDHDESLKSGGIDSPESEVCPSFHEVTNKNTDGQILKPNPKAYEAVHRFIGATQPENVTLFDDSQKNVEASQEFGWNGILVEQYKDKPTKNNLIPVLERYIRNYDSTLTLANELFRYLCKIFEKPMSLLPELAGPADLYYNEEESRSYTRNSRIKKIQMEITERAIELLEVEGCCPLFIDLGCGSGLSGQALSKRGYEWIGVDISPSMLGIAQEASKSLGLVRSDIGNRLAFKEDTFDYAICISAVQWLFQSYRKDHVPIVRVRTFFRSLHDIVRVRAVIQFYCGKKEIEILRSEAKRAGFHGGLVIDKEGTKNCKHFLVLSKWRPVKNASLAKLPAPGNKESRFKR